MGSPIVRPEDVIGVVNLDKPAGWTSNRVVTVVRRLLSGDTREEVVKVGHAGTLDPAATGVILLLIGRATKLTELLMDAGKEYLAEVRLGETSTTDDSEGEITPTAAGLEPDRRPTLEAIRKRLDKFVGRIDQRPPAFSAVHVDGHRAYKLARRGAEVVLPTRPVQVETIEVLGYEWPTIRVRIACGRGTYIRALARDLGEALGVGAYLSALRRTRVGGFAVEQASNPENCTPENVADWLLPAELAVAALPRIELADSHAELLGQGIILDIGLLASLSDRVSLEHPAFSQSGPIAAFDRAGHLIAICDYRQKRLAPKQVLRPTQ
ncbi:MAG: tRNA pseudouridine synthase B [Phycisphaerae bacterium]|nr:tRNA pseudouridine synthase B [Phycisphaerae bacterium]